MAYYWDVLELFKILAVRSLAHIVEVQVDIREVLLGLIGAFAQVNHNCQPLVFQRLNGIDRSKQFGNLVVFPLF